MSSINLSTVPPFVKRHAMEVPSGWYEVIRGPSRRECFQTGARDRRGSNSVASVDTTTFGTLYGLRGQRIGEASDGHRDCGLFNGPWTDSESEDECRNVARRLKGDEKRSPSHHSHNQSGSHHVVWMSPVGSEPRWRGFKGNLL